MDRDWWPVTVVQLGLVTSIAFHTTAGAWLDPTTQLTLSFSKQLARCETTSIVLARTFCG